jgi:lysophospholipase L1-like esterase
VDYLALGDSISIDEYTGVEGGGAVTQFARLISARLHDFTQDGCTTEGVLLALEEIDLHPQIVTLTAGGNDLLEQVYFTGLQGKIAAQILERAAQAPLHNLARIAQRLTAFACPVIINTIYDPTDGDDSLAADLGIPRQWRAVYDRINRSIRDLARQHGFLLADLETLFHGHGLRSADPWYVQQIEPNYAGATAIAHHWLSLYRALPNT